MRGTLVETRLGQEREIVDIVRQRRVRGILVETGALWQESEGVKMRKEGKVRRPWRVQRKRTVTLRYWNTLPWHWPYTTRGLL